jgi:hypothetical protein
MTIDEQIADHLLHIRRGLDLMRSDMREMLQPANSQDWYKNFVGPVGLH